MGGEDDLTTFSRGNVIILPPDSKKVAAT